MAKEKNFFDQIKEIDAKEKHAEEEKARIEQEKLQHEEKLVQDEYNKRLQLERVELMRLKQGVIAEPELVVQEEKAEKIYTPKEKISNFFYHNKLYIILITFAAIIAFFMIHDMVTTVRPDANLLIICSNDELSLKTDQTEELFEKYSKDKNDDGKIYVPVSYIPVDDSTTGDPQIYQANITKLIGEIQSNDSTIIIGNKETFTKVELADYLVDLRERYPDKKNVNEYGILLKDTKLAEKLGISNMGDDLVLCVQQIDDEAKEKVKKNHENSLYILDSLMKDIG